MKTRIRCAVILIKGDKILLVKHVHPETGFTWWVPPGGGLETKDKNILACARREVFEETGLIVDLGDILYIREFSDKELHCNNLEIFFEGIIISGELSINHIPPGDMDEAFIKEVRWLEAMSLSRLTIFPEHLKTPAFWAEINKDIQGARYLGKQIGG
ncbi:MAG: NUDIX domain-containing protein [Anaerolineaceae bacterium]|nr:NUDIX domain-containing protein [Anaerolineaceae bacterium]